MKIKNWSHVFFNGKIFNYLLVLLGFFLCISVFISDLIIFSILILWLIDANWKRKWKKIKSNNFSIAIIAFFTFYLLGLFWGDFNLDTWKWISKQSLLLIIPVIISSEIKKKFISLAIISFLLGMFINSIISIGDFLDFWNISYHHYPNENVAIGFLDHFDHSVFLAFASIIIISSLLKLENTIKINSLYITVLLLFLISLFLSHGRAGQYVFLILLSLFFVVKFYKNYTYLILSFLLLSTGIALTYSSSDIFQKRSNQLLKEAINFYNLLSYSSTNTEDNTVTDTAIGDRLTYIINYSRIANENLLFGCGTGNSLKEYNKFENKIFPNVLARPPHNNYLFILVEVGLFGLLLWLNIFIQLFITFFKHDKLDFLKLAFPLMFLIICFTDEYLVRHDPTLFFCFFTSLFCVNHKISSKDLKLLY